MGRENDITPPSVYYDSPNFPVPSELKDWTSLIITPDEAEIIIINSIAQRKNLTQKQLRVLNQISMGRNEVDLLAKLRNLETEEDER